jgi:hypothetical protein
MQISIKLESWTPIILDTPQITQDGLQGFKQQIVLSGLIVPPVSDTSLEPRLVLIQVINHTATTVRSLSGILYELGSPSFETEQIYLQVLKKPYDRNTVMDDLHTLCNI